MDKTLVRVLAIPIAGVVLLLVGLLWRRGVEPSAEVARTRAAHSAPVEYSTVRIPAAPAPAPPEKIAQATESVRIRGTYQNFRRAVATGDPELQKTLLPVLLKDREMALKCADEDLSRAGNDLDRRIARQVREALRN